MNPNLRMFKKIISAYIPNRVLRNYRPIEKYVQRKYFEYNGARPKHVVVMFHVGRCGSTALGNMINQNSDILWRGEIYHTRWESDGFAYRTDRDWKIWTENEIQLAGSRVFGFEFKVVKHQHLKIVNMNICEYIQMLENIGVKKFIILERKNYLRRMISQYVGSKTKLRHLRANQNANLKQIELPVKNINFGDGPNMSLFEALSLIDFTYRSLETQLISKDFMKISYEDDMISGSMYQLVSKLCDFLEIENIDASLENSRTNPFPIKDILINFKAVQDHLSGTKYEWMIYD